MQLQINLLEVFHGQRKIVGASGHVRIKASHFEFFNTNNRFQGVCC